MRHWFSRPPMCSLFNRTFTGIIWSSGVELLLARGKRTNNRRHADGVFRLVVCFALGVNMWKKIKLWYIGETVMNDPIIEPDLIMVPPPYTKYHWTAKLARSLVSFYIAHWQWMWGTAIAVAGLYVAIIQLNGR